MKKFSYVFFALVLTSQSGFAQADKVRIITSRGASGDQKVALKSTFNGSSYIFQMCEQVETTLDKEEKKLISFANCKTIGSPKGYTRKQIEERVKSLNLLRAADWTMDVAVIGVTLATSFIVGGLMYFGSGRAQLKGAEALIADAKFIGSVFGPPLIVGYLVWGSDLDRQIENLRIATNASANDPATLFLEISEENMVHAINEISATLIGIGE